jgi:hypothetical protein
METTTERAQAVQNPAETANGDSALDDYMTARMTGEQVEAPAPASPVVTPAVVPVKNEQGEVVTTLAVETPPVEAPVVPETPASTPSETPTEEEARISSRLRLDHLSDDDKVSQNRIQALTKTGMTLVEATRMILGSQLAPQQQQQAEPVQPTEIQNLETRQVEIGAKLLELSGDELNRDEINALTREEMINAARLESLKIFAERDNSQQQQIAAQIAQQRTNESFAAAARMYPEIATESSAIWKEANAIATDPSHPDYDPDLLGRPNAPVLVAKIAAANLGIKVASAAPVAAAVPASPSLAQPSSTVAPAAPSKGTAPAPLKPPPLEVAKRSEELARAAIEGEYAPSRAAAEPKSYVLL